jgi:hypothetical protein
MPSKILYAACTIVVAAGGLAYVFRSSLLPHPNPPPPIVAQPTKDELPAGAILIPDADGTCHLHMLDNATGVINDYGPADCSNASNQNAAVWRRAMSKDTGIEVSKSFRHEPDR